MLSGELQSLLIPLSLFTLLATATPGPNNILLSWCGSQFGMRQTIAFILGIRIGIGLIFLLMSSGIGVLIATNPHWHLGLKLIGAAYLVYLAIKMLQLNPDSQCQQSVEVIGMKQGMLLQFINPKAMMVVLSCVTTFSLPGEMYQASMIQAFIVFTIIGTLSNGLWVFLGASAGRFLSGSKGIIVFNRLLALLTLLSVVLLLAD